MKGRPVAAFRRPGGINSSARGVPPSVLRTKKAQIISFGVRRTLGRRPLAEEFIPLCSIQEANGRAFISYRLKSFAVEPAATCPLDTTMYYWHFMSEGHVAERPIAKEFIP